MPLEEWMLHHLSLLLQLGNLRLHLRHLREEKDLFLQIGYLHLLVVSAEAHVHLLLDLGRAGQLYSQRHHVWDLAEHLVRLVSLEASQRIRELLHLNSVRHLLKRLLLLEFLLLILLAFHLLHLLLLPEVEVLSAEALPANSVRHHL